MAARIFFPIWETGRLSNQEIGALFGLTYSAVSRQVKLFRNRMSAEKTLFSAYQKIKAHIIGLNHTLGK